MKWIKYTVTTTNEAVDFISNLFDEIGIEGIEIEDHVPLTESEKKQMYVDILPDLGNDDGIAKVSFYLEPEQDQEEMLTKVREGLEELRLFVNVGDGSIVKSQTEDKDWINNWKTYFKPFRIDDSIVIKPTWEELTDVKDTDMVIEIDPGLAFGTGSHETTKLCILSLKKYLKPDTELLDVGSGSGILSIVGRKLGAKKVLGVDIDEMATKTAFENAEVNHLAVGDGLQFMTGNMLADDKLCKELGEGEYDIAVANILADVIIPLSGIIGYNIKPEGLFICSGIIDTKIDAVTEALEKNKFEILEINRMKDWAAFVAKKQK